MNRRNSLLACPSRQGITSPPLWDEPAPPLPTPAQPPLSPQAARRLKQLDRYPNSLPTDVIEWLTLNKPQSFDELMDLRKTLYSRKSNFGKYFITQRGHTSLGEPKVVLNGPGGAVLILSNKSRHYLLRTLNRLRRTKGWPPIVY
jgi:hypothetical protein